MEHVQHTHASEWPAASRVETLSLADPCAVWLRPSWPLMVVGGLVVADAAPRADTVSVMDIPGWPILRALLLHGVVLRDRLTLLPSAELDRAHTPRELLDVIRGQGERWWHSLLITAAEQGWRHHQAHAPAADAEALRAAWDAASGWRDQVLLQATLWPAASQGVAVLLDDPSQCWDVLQAVVIRVGQFVDEHAPRLPRAERRTYVDADHAFRHLVGRSLGPGIEGREVHDVTAVPTPGLGGTVPIARHGTRWTVWISLALPDADKPPDVHRTLALLGDPLNQQVVEQLANGPSYAQALAPTLNTHASTLSRHLTALGDAGIVRVRPEGHRVWYHLHAPALEAVEHWAASVRAEAMASVPAGDGRTRSDRT
ncbi:MAG: metalloregulator ArsR/SmtB family transcription factor [Thermaerobacter sp.]|nr:metalloregulator ArsR/SmtB family transcription factor [Thermaerobacter sp.]